MIMLTANGFFEWVDCERQHLPLVNELECAVRYIYLYGPQPRTYGFRAAIWLQNANSEHWRIVYDTGAIKLTNPDGFHEEVESRMKETHRSQPEVVKELVEETWPETHRRLIEFKRANEPLRDECMTVPRDTLDEIMREAERHGIFSAERRHPESFQECSVRILARKENGEERDLITSFPPHSDGIGRFVMLAWQLACTRV
jgi:hypothetical protein